MPLIIILYGCTTSNLHFKKFLCHPKFLLSWISILPWDKSEDLQLLEFHIGVERGYLPPCELTFWIELKLRFIIYVVSKAKPILILGLPSVGIHVNIVYVYAPYVRMEGEGRWLGSHVSVGLSLYHLGYPHLMGQLLD